MSTPGEGKKKRSLNSQASLGGGDSWTRTNDPIDVNDVLYRLSHATTLRFEVPTKVSSHHGRNYKPLSTGQQVSSPLKSKDSAFRQPSGKLLKTAVYPSVYPVHSCCTQPYTTPAVHKNGHQILLWCRRSIGNEIRLMYNALYLMIIIRFHPAEYHKECFQLRRYRHSHQPNKHHPFL